MIETVNLESQEIENAYKDLVEYEKEVNNYLLYITGYHSKYEIEKFKETDEVKRNIENLQKKIYFSTRIGHLLYDKEDLSWKFSDGKIYTSKELIEKRTNITRDIRYRLDATMLFYQEIINSK